MSAQPMRHRFTADEYERMGAAGLFGDGARLELIEGEIIEMTPIGSPHQACVDRLTRLFTVALGERAIVRVQGPIRLGTRSEPQPDVAVLRARDDFYGRSHPRPADVLLLVEVSDTTLTWDRDMKAPLYGAAGIPKTWVVDLSSPSVHVFTTPQPGGYADARQAVPGDTITATVLDGLTVTVTDILGPA